MKDFPGTLTGLLLRISQCVFAGASIASMATTSSFFNFTTFWGLFRQKSRNSSRNLSRCCRMYLNFCFLWLQDLFCTRLQQLYLPLQPGNLQISSIGWGWKGVVWLFKTHYALSRHASATEQKREIATDSK